jgi:hypothetical protein
MFAICDYLTVNCDLMKFRQDMILNSFKALTELSCGNMGWIQRTLTLCHDI